MQTRKRGKPANKLDHAPKAQEAKAAEKTVPAVIPARKSSPPVAPISKEKSGKAEAPAKLYLQNDRHKLATTYTIDTQKMLNTPV